jgi:hypothetical protein
MQEPIDGLAGGGPLPCACVYASLDLDLEGEMAKRRAGRMSYRQRQGRTEDHC